MTEQKLTAEEQALVDRLTERLGRTPTERELAMTKKGFRVVPPSGKGYIMPMGRPPPKKD
jgi:hypothetical protein